MTLSISVVDESESAPQVRIQVSSSPAVTETLTVYRIHEDGTRYVVLSDQPPILVGGSWVGRDYHPPGNQLVTYVAETDTQTSPASTPLFVVLEATWLISSSDPSKSMPVTAVLDLESLSWDDPAERSQALGSDTPVYRWDRERSGPSSSITIHCDTPEEAARVLSLLKPGGPILLNMSRTEPIGWMWIQPGKPIMGTPGGKWKTAYRSWSFGFERCQQPDVDILSPWNFDAVTAAYADFNAVTAAYADFDSLTLDVN